MEHRDDGLLVDFSGTELRDTGQRSGRYAIVNNQKQETEMRTLDQETRLMRAMNEIREYTPKNMTSAQRELFNELCENIFAKHGITPDYYRDKLRHLGTPQNLRR